MLPDSFPAMYTPYCPMAKKNSLPSALSCVAVIYSRWFSPPIATVDAPCSLRPCYPLPVPHPLVPWSPPIFSPFSNPPGICSRCRFPPIATVHAPCFPQPCCTLSVLHSRCPKLPPIREFFFSPCNYSVVKRSLKVSFYSNEFSSQLIYDVFRNWEANWIWRWCSSMVLSKIGCYTL